MIEDDILSKKLTNEEFIKKVKNFTNVEYIFLESYKSYSEKLKVRHNICNNTYKVTPSNFFNGYRCPYCSKRPTINKFNFNEKVLKNRTDITLIDGYINIHTKIKFRCNKCNRIFESTPNNIRNGSGCPYCISNRKLTIKDISNKIRTITNDEYELLSDEYKNNKTKLDIKHKLCGNIYKVSWSNFQQGYRCPYCSDKNNSKSIRFIESFLNLNKIVFKKEVTFNDLKNPLTNRNLYFDFYIPEYDLYLEYDGSQHFKDPFNNDLNKLEQTKYRDSLKNEYCKNKGLKLIRISYKDDKNLNKILNDIFKDKKFNDYLIK